MGGTSRILPFLVERYKALDGTPYVWGGKDPKTGLDCSGLVTSFYNLSPGLNAEGLYNKLPRQTGEPQVGDILYFKETDPKRPKARVTHTGIYMGKDKSGESLMFHAARKGVPAKLTVFGDYYKKRLVGASVAPIPGPK